MPYNIIKNGRKYELRLVKNNQLLGTHTTKKGAESQIKAIEISKTGRKNPDLYEKAKEIADNRYGLEHSARKQQQITRIYKDLGGEYTDDLKPNQLSLQKWSLEDWGRDIPDGRYLPKYVREKLTPEEYLKTSIAKIKGDKQYVKQPEEIVKKIRKIKLNPPSIIKKIYEGKGQTKEKSKKVKIGNHIYTYYLSDKPNKKLMTIVNGKKIYFGATGYHHFRDKTSLLNPELSHYDDTRRKRYINRHSKIEDKEGNLVIFNPESPAFHSLNILW